MQEFPPPVNTVGRNVRRLREEMGIGYRPLADAAGVSYKTLIGIELGYDTQKDPQMSTLTKIAKALGVTVTDLLREYDERPALPGVRK